jgi:hypothetical protein
MLTLFNPSLEIQSTDNYIDWTSLSVVELDSVTWTSRTIPIGTENPIDVATLKFSLPIWISSPAKVKKLGVIERVIASIYDSNGDLNDAVTNNDLLLGTRQIITPYNYAAVVIGNQVQCLQQQSVVSQPDNNTLTPTNIDSNSNLLWSAVISMYGTLRPGISQLRLMQADESEVVGTITVDPNDERFLILDVDTDTQPQNTMPAVNAVINPLMSAPGYGLPAVAEGQRYLLTEATGAAGNQFPAVAWLGINGRPLAAEANDIIEFRNGFWNVPFISRLQSGQQYISNLTTGIQYEWTGDSWIKSYQGVYPGGTWRLVL